MLNAIAKPFGVLLMWLYEFFGNYGLAVIVFALLVKLILLPFQMKSKRGMMQTSRLQPRLKELEKKHGANKTKYNEEVAKLYKEEKVSPMSGCIWSLIPFPILIALYQAIRYPLTIMMGVPSDLLSEGGAPSRTCCLSSGLRQRWATPMTDLTDEVHHESISISSLP
jgi:YidC/Oxa1 family membrane protein insertase